jgi:hypothetical protein
MLSSTEGDECDFWMRFTGMGEVLFGRARSIAPARPAVAATTAQQQRFRLCRSPPHVVQAAPCRPMPLYAAQ